HGLSDLILIIHDKHQLLPRMLLPRLPRDTHHQITSNTSRLILDAARAGRLPAPGLGLAVSLLPPVFLRPEGGGIRSTRARQANVLFVRVDLRKRTLANVRVAWLGTLANVLFVRVDLRKRTLTKVSAAWLDTLANGLFVIVDLRKRTLANVRVAWLGTLANVLFVRVDLRKRCAIVMAAWDGHLPRSRTFPTVADGLVGRVAVGNELCVHLGEI